MISYLTLVSHNDCGVYFIPVASLHRAVTYNNNMETHLACLFRGVGQSRGQGQINDHVSREAKRHADLLIDTSAVWVTCGLSLACPVEIQSLESIGK